MTMRTGLLATLWTGAAAMSAVLAAPAERAAPPVWTRDVLDAFFEDARDALEGQRPEAALDGPRVAPTSDEPPAPGEAGFAWSRLVSADTLTGEVTRLANELQAPLANPTVFAAGGHQQCQAAFGLLAVLWAMIDEFDGEVRWRQSAAALRDAAAQTARNCQTATDKSYADAVARRQELEDLVRGGRFDGGEAGPFNRWSELTDRRLLMQRMQVGLQERIGPQLSDARAFARAAAAVRHEAEVLAALAEVIRREDYEFWDDETFVEYAADLGAAATELARAAASGDYDAARAAAGRAGQSCVACHDGYRG